MPLSRHCIVSGSASDWGVASLRSAALSATYMLIDKASDHLDVDPAEFASVLNTTLGRVPVACVRLALGPQADEAKIRNYCENSLDHFNWLVDHLGVPFKDSFHKERAIMCLTDDGLLYTGSEKAYPFKEQAEPAPRGHNLYIEGDNGGPMFMKIVTENVEKRDNIFKL